MTNKFKKLDNDFAKLSLSKYGKLPIYDGIVDLEIFKNTYPKVLWILKEVNSPEDECDWDMREAIKSLKSSTGLKRGWGNTFTSIVYVSEGIIKNKEWDEIPYLYDNPDTIDVLNSIAFINLKKNPGKSRANTIELYEAYVIYKDLLFKQINLINPDIIIFGGTYLYFKNDIPNDNFKHCGSCNVFKIDDKIFVDAYHPQYIGINREKYFTDIITGIKSIP